MKKIKTIAAVILAVSIISGTFAGAEVISSDGYAARPTSTTCLYANKNETSEVICLLYDTFNYEVVYTEDSWTRIKINSDVVGYVRTDDIILLEGASPSQSITYSLSTVLGTVEAAADTVTKSNEKDKKASDISSDIISQISDYVDEAEGYYEITTTVADDLNTIKADLEIANTAEEIASVREAQQDAKAALSDAKSKAEEVAALRESVVDYACSFVDILPYVWGGTSLVTGADCSGFVQSIYAKFGYSLSRTTTLQASNGVAVSYSDLKPGDLILFSGHVGIYIGNDQFVHSPRTGKKVSISTLSTYPKSIKTIRRIIV